VKRDRNEESWDRNAERARWVRRYRSSGLGLRQFAERQDLSPGQLRYWVYGPTAARRSKAPAPVFHEVRFPAPTALPVPWSTEIGLPDGTTVRLARGTDVAGTIALIECLRRPCSSL